MSSHLPLLRLVVVAFLVLASSNAAALTRYVDQKDPAAIDEGDGTATRPFRTISYAITQLRLGDRLIIRGGLYRETLDLRLSPAWREMSASDVVANETIIEGAVGEKVLIKGSIAVKGWEPLGNGLFVKRAWPHNSQQVFVSSVPLRQVGGVIFGDYPTNPLHPLAAIHNSQGGIWPGRIPGGVAQLVENSFFYDLATKDLYIKVPYTSLAGRVVEVSARQFNMIGDRLDMVTIRNLTFLHSNTTATSRAGSVALNGSNMKLERLEILYSDGIALTLSGNSVTVDRCMIRYAGRAGIIAVGRDYLFTDTETSFGNSRGFNKWWEAGGLKVIGTESMKNSEIVRHRALYNRGDGIWFDTGHDNIHIRDSVSAYNQGFGIHYEASQRGYIYNNYVFGNTQRGIYLMQSSSSVVAHNLIVDNGLEGFGILDAARRDPTGVLDLRPKANGFIGNIVAYNAQAEIFPDVDSGNASDYNLFVNNAPRLTFTVARFESNGLQVHELQHWRNETQQDRNSRHIRTPMSAALTAALAGFVVDADFSSLLGLAATMTTSYALPPWSSIPALIPVAGRPGPY